MTIRLLLILCIFVLYGCSDIKMPSTEYALTHPLSTKTMVLRGATKNAVRAKWGDPSEIKDLGYDEMGLKKEAWIYDPWFRKAPLDYRNFSRKKCIYFIGDHVTGFEDINDK